MDANLVTTDSPTRAIRARLCELDSAIIVAEIRAVAAAECAAESTLLGLPDSALWHARNWTARRDLTTELRMQSRELTRAIA